MSKIYKKTQQYVAVAAVKNGMSQTTDSKRFGIPQSTISQNIRKNIFVKSKPGKIYASIINN